RGIEITCDLLERETVCRRQREHDIVFGRRRLQLEIELAAEPLAQRQSPGPIDAAAKGRMDDELHAADFVEETLEHDRVLRREAAQRRKARGKVLHQLTRRRLGDADLVGEALQGTRAAWILAQRCGYFGAKTRYCARQLV